MSNSSPYRDGPGTLSENTWELKSKNQSSDRSNKVSSARSPYYVDENHRYLKGQDGLPVKYHKSCNYCRHRKIKCLVLPGELSCNHCKQCEIHCIFSRKLPSRGRIMKSAKIAAKVYAQNRLQLVENLEAFNNNGLESLATAAAKTDLSISDTANRATYSVQVMGEQQNLDYLTIKRSENTKINRTSIQDVLFNNVDVPSSEDTSSCHNSGLKYRSESNTSSVDLPQLVDPDPYSHIGLEDSSNLSIETMINLPSRPYDLYYDYVYPYTPFASLQKIEQKNDNDVIFNILLNIACSSAPGNVAPSPIDILSAVKDHLKPLCDFSYIVDDVTISLLCCVMAHCKVTSEFADALWKKYQSFSISDHSIETSVGVATVSSWYSLLDNLSDTFSIVDIPISLFESVTLNESQFSGHFIELSLLLYKFQLLILKDFNRQANSPGEAPSLTSSSPISLKYKLTQLESDLLLWPVKLPKDLIVVKNDMLATSNAIVLHIFHNTVTLAFYMRSIYDKFLSRYLSIYPVPGLLQFLCGMATSSLKVGHLVSKKWPIVRHCVRLTAKYMLDLYNETEFEHCKVSLAFYDDQFLDPSLYNRIQQILGSEDWKSKDFDGAIIYWVFRDTRSMSLDSILNRNDQK